MSETAGVALYSARFCDDCHVTDTIMYNINAVLDDVQREVERKRLDAMAVPVAADAAMIKIRRLMAWAVLEHDGKFEENVPLEYLEPDTEPAALIIDPWARGMVPTKVVKAEDSGGMYRTLGGQTASGNLSPRSESKGSRVSSNTGTSRSGTSRPSIKSGGAKSGTSRAGTATGTRVDEEEQDPTGLIFDLEDSDEENFPGTDHMSLDQLLKKQAKAKAGEVSENQQEVKLSEYEIMQKEIENQVKELKGKKYTVDRDGTVIPLAPVKSNALPPYQVAPDTKITNYEEKASRGGSRKGTANASAPAGDAPGSAIAKNKQEKGKRLVRVAGSRTVDEYTFLPSYTLSDTLSAGEGLMPTSGVVISVNDQKRQGPAIPTIPGKMSRKEYAARNTVGGAALDASSLEEGIDAGSSLLQPGELAFNDSQLPLSMQGGAPTMRSELQYKIPDIDTMAGGRRKVLPGDPSSPTQREDDANAGLGPVSSALGGDPSVATRPGPKDPTVRLFNHDVSKTGKPTDRDLPQNMKPPSERTKQLAPPPGIVSKYDSPNKFAAARAAQGLGPKGSTTGPGSPQGSTAGDSAVGSRAGQGGSKNGNFDATASKSKVGQIRTKPVVHVEKPHVAAQIF